MNKKTREVLHSSKKDDWRTPKWLFELLNKQYHFTLDLCAREDNSLLSRFCQDVQSGMLIDLDWGDTIPIDWDKEVFFCNPPYGKKWKEILKVLPINKVKGIFLLPSRTGSKWFQKMLKSCDWILFLSGRLKFEETNYNEKENKKTNPAPFDSVIIGYKLDIPDGLNGEIINKRY